MVLALGPVAVGGRRVNLESGVTCKRKKITRVEIKRSQRVSCRGFVTVRFPTAVFCDFRWNSLRTTIRPRPLQHGEMAAVSRKRAGYLIPLAAIRPRPLQHGKVASLSRMRTQASKVPLLAARLPPAMRGRTLHAHVSSSFASRRREGGASLRLQCH